MPPKVLCLTFGGQFKGGWLDTYYLRMVPTSQIVLNRKLTQNPGYNELFGLGE